jgi:NitT/TauT family transport system ATP-binding protein
MLKVSIAAKSYRPGAPPVLRDLNFALGAKEIVALVGPSGCGKTTLLRILAGLDKRFEGSIEWAASPVLGLVFQEPRLLPWRSVAQNLALVATPETPPDLARTLLAALGLEHQADTPAQRLSLGMARRVALARAFLVEPSLLLLDEPFVSLDEASGAASRALLLDLWRQRPTAVLLVTHDLAEAAMLADRILFLSAGPARVIREAVIDPAERRGDAGTARDLADRLRDF